MYVYALVDRICAMPIKKLMKKNLKEIPDSFCFFNHSSKGYKFRAVDFNYREGEIYFSEFGTSVKTIRRARLEKKSVNSVLVYGTGDVRGGLWEGLGKWGVRGGRVFELCHGRNGVKVNLVCERNGVNGVSEKLGIKRCR